MKINPIIKEPVSSIMQGKNLNANKESIKINVEKSKEEKPLTEEEKAEKLIDLLV